MSVSASGGVHGMEDSQDVLVHDGGARASTHDGGRAGLERRSRPESAGVGTSRNHTYGSPENASRSGFAGVALCDLGRKSPERVPHKNASQPEVARVGWKAA